MTPRPWSRVPRRLLGSVRRRLTAHIASRLSAGVVVSLRSLGSELAVQRRHRYAVRAVALLPDGPLRLHLGSGRKHLPGWVDVDLTPEADLHLDLRERLPFADGTVSAVYSEHLMEHLEYPSQVNDLLAECLRVLEPGGTFSVGVPDIEEALRQYASGELSGLLQEWARDPALAWVDPEVWTTPAHYVNWLFRQGDEHKYAYDTQTLTLVLERAGFIDVQRRPFDPRRDSADRADGTLYMDGTKPFGRD